MKLVRDARTLKTKALSSLRTGMRAFNSFDDDGRITSVLLHLQHACEMLLKAVLVQNQAKVFDKEAGRSITFEKCLGLCTAHFRSLLAMESIAVEEVVISERDIDRIEKAVRAGHELLEVFPRLSPVGTHTDGEGLNLVVHFTKKQGAPVRYIGGDDPADAAAVRELDLQKKFYLGAADLAQKLGLPVPPLSRQTMPHPSGIAQ